MARVGAGVSGHPPSGSRRGRDLQRNTVRVYGSMDDDLFENEASSVYVQNLGTYFYASSADEEDTYVPRSLGLDPLSTEVTGTVTGIHGRTFTIDTGARQLTVDTTGDHGHALQLSRR